MRKPLHCLSLFAALLFNQAALADLLVYAGAASQLPTEEAAREFEEETGIRVDVIFGGSGYVLSQMKLARQGDLYFPGSSVYMEKAKRDGDVFSETEQRVVYLVNAINVPAGNPKNIRGLTDLLEPGLRIAIANPDGVCVGAYAVEIIENSLDDAQVRAFRNNLVNYVGSCAKTASVIALGAVDAVIGWRVFAHWDPKRIETIPLQADQIARIGYIPIAISRYSNQVENAQRFIDFLMGAARASYFCSLSVLPEPRRCTGMDWQRETRRR